ncbi:MAG TPA: rhamnulokinase family protein [Acidothermaceae bacterium]|jgi:rhamnulokinase
MGSLATTTQAFAAVDLGASSGRVMVGSVTPDAITVRETHRFHNQPVEVAGTLYWDVLSLWAGVSHGLRLARRGGELVSVGVDAWAVDYALLDSAGQLLANPIHYRDARTKGVADAVARVVSFDQLYAATGVQPLPFNTLFQWVAARDTAPMREAAHALLIPDLFCYWLTGELGCELTNASTTGLLDVRTKLWSDDLFTALKLRRSLLAPLRAPGESAGVVSAQVAAEFGIEPIPVIAVGSHDTASAVAAVPAQDERFAYISSGTWSLVGVETKEPVMTPRALSAGFTNEIGVDGRVRFLRNVMGLWLLQESFRAWERAGTPLGLPALLAEAARLPAGRFILDPDRPDFLPPGDMPERLRAECRRIGQDVPQSPGEIVRCVLDSLAAAYARSVRAASELSGVPVDVVHILGGGARNALLCQLTADACELPVVAGPAEATAYGNVLVQARAAGVLHGEISELRFRFLRGLGTITYQPRGPLAASGRY